MTLRQLRSRVGGSIVVTDAHVGNENLRLETWYGEIINIAGLIHYRVDKKCISEGTVHHWDYSSYVGACTRDGAYLDNDIVFVQTINA